MEVHIMILSTMSVSDTASNLRPYNIAFDEQEGTIQKFKWVRENGPVSVSLWVACMHPLTQHLAASFVPHMDACVCWYHDHDGLSCVRVQAGMELLQSLHENVRLMATTFPEKYPKHASRVRKYYSTHGFEIERLMSNLPMNIEEILRVHLNIQKHL